MRPWESIGMDFVGPFLEVDGFNYLWVIICKMSSMVHLVLVNTTTASQLSMIYICEVVCLHRLLSLIVNDWDPKFTSKWWHELHQLLGMKLLMFTSFHPQMDGAMEWANRSMGQMFRSLIKPDQKDWVHQCLMIEFAINSSIGDATKLALLQLFLFTL